MNLRQKTHVGPALDRQRTKWLLCMLLATSLFFILHWPIDVQRDLDDYNRPQEDIVAGMAGSAVREGVLIGLAGVAIISLLKGPATYQFCLGIYFGWSTIFFGAWASLSCIWADDMSLTSKRLISFAILSLAAFAVVRRSSIREVLIWTVVTTSIFLLVSILVELVAGSFRPFVGGYRFAGIQHPNGAAIECGILFLASLASATYKSRFRWLFLLAAVFGFVFLMLTASRTGLAATLVALLMYLCMVTSALKKTIALSLTGFVASILIFAVTAGVVGGMGNTLSLGRDDIDSPDSLSGRTQIWSDVSPYILERPIAGHGYGGFWTPAHIGTISDEEKWGVPDSHSTYFDYLLTLGIVGLLLYAVMMLGGLWRAWRLYHVSRDPELAFMASLLLFCIVDGVCESAIGEGSLLTFLSLIVLFRLGFVPPQNDFEAVSYPSRLEEVWPA